MTTYVKGVLVTTYVDDGLLTSYFGRVLMTYCACGSVLCEDVIMTYLHPHTGLIARSTTMSSSTKMHGYIHSLNVNFTGGVD